MSGRRRTVAIAAAAVLVAVVPATAGPVSTTSPQPVAHGTALSAQHPVLSFHGQMDNPTPLPTVSDPDPTVCAVDCDLWALSVHTTQRFLVAVHNGNASIDDGLDLHVYDPAGKELATAEGIGADGQAVAITPTTAGTYTIAVTVTYAYDAHTRYLGEARIMSAPSWREPRCAQGRACPLLPALKVRPPSDPHVDGIPLVASTPLGFPIPLGTSTGNSCYLDENAATGATRCLRFTSEVDNVGIGLLTLRIRWAGISGNKPGAATLPGQCEAQQVIDRTDGTSTVRDAGPCMFHPQHMHFHYLNFVQFSLHAVTTSGTTGRQVARSLKESFCLADDGYFGFAQRGPNGPRTYAGQPDCNVPSAPSSESPDAWIRMGVSPGWGDIYTWDTPSQYIDISDTPPGVYDIVSRANPAGTLLLAGPRSSCAASRIRLTNSSVKVLDPDVPCS